MINWTLIIIIAIFILLAFLGLKKGFIKSLSSFLAMIVAILFAYMLSPGITNIIVEHTPLVETIKEKIGVNEMKASIMDEGINAINSLSEEEYEELDKKLGEEYDLDELLKLSGEELVKVIDEMDVKTKELFEKGMDFDGWETVTNFLSASKSEETVPKAKEENTSSTSGLFNIEDMHLSEDLKESIESLIEDARVSLMNQGMEAVDNVTDTLIRKIINAIIFVIIYIIAVIIIRICLSLINGVISSITITNYINKILGLVFGIARATIWIMVILTILSVILPMGFLPSVAQNIEDSTILTYMYNNNPVFSLVLKR